MTLERCRRILCCAVRQENGRSANLISCNDLVGGNAVRSIQTTRARRADWWRGGLSADWPAATDPHRTCCRNTIFCARHEPPSFPPKSPGSSCRLRPAADRSHCAHAGARDGEGSNASKLHDRCDLICPDLPKVL